MERIHTYYVIKCLNVDILMFILVDIFDLL